MKKLLALVLALVMTLSLATVSSNAAFNDADKVKDTYAEAVEVLTGMGVIKGYEDGSFKPEGSITRAEVAAVVYRIYTADVKDKNVGLYAGYSKFDDLTGANWAKGYIGYCANAELVRGYNATKFGPLDNVTGYQALAMILRAMGYDKNGEFTGKDWELHVAQTAQQLGILKNAGAENLSAPASRQLVAELFFQAIQKDCVSYTPAFGYVANTIVKSEGSLGKKNFGLTKTDASNDKWGRPLYKWTNGKTGSALVTYATIKATPVKTYQAAVTECDVAHDASISTSAAYTLYVNGDKQLAKYVVNATDTTTKMGAQGRLFELYDDTIVMIDTYLAKVTYVAEATFDPQGHLKTPSTITFTVYEAGTINTTTQLKTAQATPYSLTNGKTNYEYAVGDYILVNAYTATTRDRYDLEYGDSNTVTMSGPIIIAEADKYAEIVGKATSLDGAQSIIYWNATQHNVEGTVYNDAVKFWLDEAGKDATKHTWFFDSYGNLIGAVDIAAATSYGVINKIWWAGNTADGSGVAKADVTYMDGTTGQVDISEITYSDAAVGNYTVKTGVVTHSTNTATTTKLMTAEAGYFYVDSYATENARYNGNGILNDNLFQFTTKANGTLKAIEVAGNGQAIAAAAANASETHPVYYRSAIPAGLYNTEVAVSKNTQVYAGTTVVHPHAWSLVVNDNTQFLVRTKVGSSYTFTAVKGFTNIGSYDSAEVDMVDLNGDKVADYVYVIAPSATSKVTSLFFFDGQQGAYTLADGTWVVKGYVDGVAGEVKFANYTALYGTLTKMVSGVATATAPEANTLYVVALEDGVVKAGYKAADTGVQDLKAITIGTAPNAVTYPLAAVYAPYGDTLNITYIAGDAGTAPSYADRDTYTGSLYHDYSANMYYSVIAENNTTKIVGTMGIPGNQNYYFVYVDRIQGNLDQFCVQAYAFDKNTAKDAITVTSTSVVASNWGSNGVGSVNTLLSDAEFTAVGAGVKADGTAVSNIKLTATAKWYVRLANETSFREAGANEVIVPGGSYYAVITLSVPSSASATTTILPNNQIAYYGANATTGNVVTTGTGSTVTTNIFTR